MASGFAELVRIKREALYQMRLERRLQNKARLIRRMRMVLWVDLPILARWDNIQPHDVEFYIVVGNPHANKVVIRTNPQRAESIVSIHSQEATGYHHIPTKEAGSQHEPDREHLDEQQAEP